MATVCRCVPQSAGAPLLLLAAAAAGVAVQGGFFSAGRSMIGALLAAALIAALMMWPPTMTDLRLEPVLAAGALAGWAVIDGAVHTTPAGAAQYALLLAGLVAVLLVCRRLDAPGRELLLGGILAVGLMAAATGWVGVAWHLSPWARPDQGLWRAASTLTYANATAALLVPLALVALGLLITRPRSAGLALAATGLLVGAGATLSRAGGAGLLAGLLLLAALAGVGRTLRATAGPAVGATIAVAGLLPAMPEAAAPHPVLGLITLATGLALAVLLSRQSTPVLAAMTATAALAGGLLAVGWTPASVTAASHQIRLARINVASPDRSGETTAALDLLATRPLTGVGPGQVTLRWTGPDGGFHLQRYVHNEYLQVTTELGAIGGVLLAWLLAALALLAWRGRVMTSSRATWAGIVAGLAALVVHSGFDFVWHLPVIPLIAVVLIGVLTTPIARPGTPLPATSPAAELPRLAQGKESG
jgi:hypothetical protein